MLKIKSVDPTSPVYGDIRPGHRLLSINGSEIDDVIDFRYKSSEPRLEVLFEDKHGRQSEYLFEDLYPGALGLTFEDDKVHVCKCDCIFCFVRQQPKGMRRALYVKDEDFRLSFTHGNFITLSNVTQNELDRIVEQRLSPLYISVHATDDSLRRCMLKNEKLEPVIPQLKFLAENRISLHTQVVLCPGFNDGDQLAKTIDDLAELDEMVESLAIVPVGLTRYREKLPKLRLYEPKEAAAIIDYIHKRQKEFLKARGSRFVWPADEFYIAAGRPFPRESEYEEMPQFENGVGMARHFLTDFNRRKQWLKSKDSGRRVTFLTGHSAHGFMKDEILPVLVEELGISAKIVPVTNKFWGDSVTVSGLLTGQDLLDAARDHAPHTDVMLLPPNCLNQDNLFLDDMSYYDFVNRLSCRVHRGTYNLVDTLREVL